MNPIEFAHKYFKDFRQKGSEIVPLYCPFCNGGQRHDKYTFALNVDKLTYNCKRGSCGVSGTFNQLLREFGETTKRQRFEYRPAEKKYILPKTKIKTPAAKVEEYLKKRGISGGTCEQWGVGESGGNIAFPYYENGKLVLVKFRKPEKYDGKGQKAWREEGGKAVFWGMDNCKPDAPLIIVEGEFDALAVSEAGLPNVVSVPSGAEDLTCVDNCWDWLQQFNQVVIWPDNDEPGLEMCRKLISKLGAWRCSVVHCKHKDPNEALYKGGSEEILNCFEAAQEVPIAGLIRLADVKAFDYSSTTRIRSSIQGINRVIGSFMGGQLSVWTGVNGSGKSTFLGQELLEAIEQDFSVCAYSGELPGPIFRYWIELQAAGRNNLIAKKDEYQEEKVYYVDPRAINRIREWHYDKFFLYDSFGGVTDETLLKIFEYAAMRYNCKVFLVDNLMATAIDGASDSGYYRRQADFVRQAKEFSVKHDVHVHIVAHPRKAEGRLTKFDVAGLAEITNWADNVFGLHRVGENDEQEIRSLDTLIDVFKCRFTGKQNEVVGLLFDNVSRRFYMPTIDRKYYAYGWQKMIGGASE